jgi:hypothetical protein
MTDVPVLIEIVNKLATPGIAAVSALYVLRQYHRSVAWKKSDLAANMVSRLETDEELAFACRALDWGIGPLIVPERYRPLLKAASSDPDSVVAHDTWSMYVALRPRLTEETLNDPRGLIYRYCFDKLLAHLDDANRLLKGRQVCKIELNGLQYWIKKLADYRYRPNDKAGRKVRGVDVFQPFIAAYGYGGVVALGRKFGIEEWSTYESYVGNEWIEPAQLLHNPAEPVPTAGIPGEDAER